jgi:hypothetical protein
VTGDFTVLNVNRDNGIARLSDPNSIISSGDSGGGVYYDGVLVGNTYAIKRGVVLVALNPGFVTSGDWQWMERN